MAEIKIMDFYDKDEIYSFLGHAGYRRFNLWPNTTEENIAGFLLKEINGIHESGKVFVATRSGKITSLLAVRPMDWDTQHYGFNCVKIEYILMNKTLSCTVIEESLEALLAAFKKYSAKLKIKFACADVDSLDSDANPALQKIGFRYILTWIDGIFKYSDRLPEIKEKAEVGIIKPEEINYFKEISSLDYFSGGRFYLDANFNKELVDKMYSNFISFSYENNYIMLVYRIKNQPAGLFICKKIVTYGSLLGLRVAPLRYLIVSREFRKKRVAYNLFIKTLEYLKDKSDLITTGLDVHNLSSLNLHSKVGFKFNYTHNVYHRWDINL